MTRTLGQRIRRAGQIWNQTETAILIFLITMIWVIVFFGVIVRYTPITGQTLWTTEIARLLLLWSAFWAAGSVERFGYHFRVDLLDNVLSGKVGLFLQLFIKLVLLVSVGTLIWWTIPHIQSVLGIRLFSLKFPQVIRDVPLLIGGLLLFIHALTDFIRLFRKVFE